MFKNETVVKAALCTVLMTASLHAFTQNSPAAPPPAGYSPYGAPPNGAYQCRAYYEEKIDKVIKELRTLKKGTDDDAIKDLDSDKSRYQRGLRECVSESKTNKRSCEDPNGDYEKARREFYGACGAHPQSNERGNRGCGFAIERCNNCINGLNNSPLCSSESSAVSSNHSGLNVGQLAQNMKVCPALAAKGLDKTKDELAKQRQLVRDLRNKLSEKQKSVENDDDKATEKISQIRDQMGQEAEKNAQKMEAINDEFEKAQDQMKSELIQLRKQHTEVTDQEGEVMVRKGRIDLEYYKALSAIRLQCQAQARDAVNKLQEKQKIEIATNTRNLGDYNAFLKHATKPERTQWKEVMFKEYKECLRDPATRDAEYQALAARGKQLEAEEENERKLERKHNDINTEMNVIRSGACGSSNRISSNGLSQTSRACASVNKAKRQMDINDRLFKERMRNLGKNMSDATQKRMMANLKKFDGSNGLIGAEGDLMEEEQRLRELEALEKAQRQHSGNNNMDDAAFNTAKSKYEEFKSAGHALINCEVNRCGAYCTEAAQYLKEIGENAKNPNVDRALKSGGRGTPGGTGNGQDNNDDETRGEE